jgi:hypothetical protein
MSPKSASQAGEQRLRDADRTRAEILYVAQPISRDCFVSGTSLCQAAGDREETTC